VNTKTDVGGQREDRCPCGTGRRYPDCCGPFVDDGIPAPTAEELMRSRYTAYALRRPEHLLRTWHPSTRPEDLVLDRGWVWEGLEVVGREGGQVDDDEGVVEFRARWRQDPNPAAGVPRLATRYPTSGVMNERSLFRRRGGRWMYLSADDVPAPDSGPTCVHA
jgi:SEC-C motif domain protein